eukprot:gb/GECG01012980.1/.p1 GENE.gb/GECG01012980.1/~~gb/GECG01012980.1/.p1  ORF type:complete len:152 (+),score=8.85 gb/GECG01012980.1/:1-456(+)
MLIPASTSKSFNASRTLSCPVLRNSMTKRGVNFNFFIKTPRICKQFSSLTHVKLLSAAHDSGRRICYDEDNYCKCLFTSNEPGSFTDSFHTELLQGWETSPWSTRGLTAMVSGTPRGTQFQVPLHLQFHETLPPRPRDQCFNMFMFIFSSC